MNAAEILNTCLDVMISDSGHKWIPSYFDEFSDEDVCEANDFLREVIDGGELQMSCNSNNGTANVCIR